MGSTVNTMILGGLALAFSRVIDNSVISLENIYRHLEMGALPSVAAEIGGSEVNLAVLAATLVDVVDFFPVTLLYGVSKFLFSALALAFCLSLLVSFVVAMTVIPLFCSRFLKAVPGHGHGVRETRSARRGETTVDQHPGGPLQRRFQPRLQSRARCLRARGAAGVAVSGLTVVALGGALRRQFRHLSLSWPGLLSANRCRTVHDQHEGSHRHPHRNDRTNTSRNGRPDPAEGRAAGLSRSSFPISAWSTISPLSTPPTPGPIPPPSRSRSNDDHKTSSFEYMDRVQQAHATSIPDVALFSRAVRWWTPF